MNEKKNENNWRTRTHCAHDTRGIENSMAQVWMVKRAEIYYTWAEVSYTKHCRIGTARTYKLTHESIKISDFYVLLLFSFVLHFSLTFVALVSSSIYVCVCEIEREQCIFLLSFRWLKQKLESSLTTSKKLVASLSFVWSSKGMKLIDVPEFAVLFG